MAPSKLHNELQLFSHMYRYIIYLLAQCVDVLINFSEKVSFRKAIYSYIYRKSKGLGVWAIHGSADGDIIFRIDVEKTRTPHIPPTTTTTNWLWLGALSFHIVEFHYIQQRRKDARPKGKRPICVWRVPNDSGKTEEGSRYIYIYCPLSGCEYEVYIYISIYTYLCAHFF